MNYEVVAFLGLFLFWNMVVLGGIYLFTRIFLKRAQEDAAIKHLAALREKGQLNEPESGRQSSQGGEVRA